MSNPLSVVLSIRSLVANLLELSQHLVALKDDPEVKEVVEDVKEIVEAVGELFHNDARKDGATSLTSGE